MLRLADDALAFHRALPGYAPTPIHSLGAIASQLGVAALAAAGLTIGESGVAL